MTWLHPIAGPENIPNSVEAYAIDLAVLEWIVDTLDFEANAVRLTVIRCPGSHYSTGYYPSIALTGDVELDVMIERQAPRELEAFVVEHSVAQFAGFATRTSWHARAVDMGLFEDTYTSDEERTARQKMLETLQQSRALYYAQHKALALDSSRSLEERGNALWICASVVAPLDWEKASREVRALTGRDMRTISSSDDVAQILGALDDLFASGMPDRRERRVLATNLDASSFARDLVASDNVEIALAVQTFARFDESMATFLAWLAGSNVAWHTEAMRLKSS